MKFLWIALSILAVLLVLITLLFAYRSWRAQEAVPDLGVDGAGRLKPCPSSPNCVSSQAAGGRRAMEAWRFAPSLAVSDVQRALREASERVGNVQWLSESGDGAYLHGVFRSRLFRFPDDVEFFIDREKHVIHFRSASRVGKSDLGANRQRMERIRGELARLIGEAAESGEGDPKG
ncbi:MAG: DUF1499 domain-containing protein [Gammaproteobacteria bacterium]